jgi:hypothetical protein
MFAAGRRHTWIQEFFGEPNAIPDRLIAELNAIHFEYAVIAEGREYDSEIEVN